MQCFVTLFNQSRDLPAAKLFSDIWQALCSVKNALVKRLFAKNSELDARQAFQGLTVVFAEGQSFSGKSR